MICDHRITQLKKNTSQIANPSSSKRKEHISEVVLSDEIVDKAYSF